MARLGRILLEGGSDGLTSPSALLVSCALQLMEPARRSQEKPEIKSEVSSSKLKEQTAEDYILLIYGAKCSGSHGGNLRQQRCNQWLERGGVKPQRQGTPPRLPASAA